MVAARSARSNARIVGLTRVVVCAILLLSSEPSEALQIANHHAALWHPPEGLGWFVAVVPISATVAGIISRVYFTCAWFAIFGFYTRFALSGLFASAFYLFSVRQLGGVVLHDMHLLWLTGLLALSPSSAAWSVDTWFRGHTFKPFASRAHDADAFLFWARTLLGLIYFFPGFWKLRESGLDWALSDNLQNQLWAKWYEYGKVPSVRVDLHPGLLHALGVGTLVFELGFVFGVHRSKRVRIVLGVLGVAFHLSIEHLMFIPFSSLWCCYVVLLGAEVAKPKLRAPASLVGMVIAALLVERGFRGATQSYPFACYPTFAARIDGTLPDMLVSIDGGQGSIKEVSVARDASGHRSQAAWGEVWSVLGIYGAPLDEARLRAYLLRELGGQDLSGRKVRIEVGTFSTNPAHWGSPPMARRLVAELAF
ncbi:MAG: hypothetical protein U0174_15215 [Polyangiaceae bacterium]